MPEPEILNAGRGTRVPHNDAIPTAELPRVPAITDTYSGTQARDQPEVVLAHYARLSERLWLSQEVRAFTTELIGTAGRGKIAWGSLVGPYGFGKTATAVAIWREAREKGLLAIPPLSCTRYDELAQGIAALASVQAPEQAKAIQRLLEEVWSESLEQMAARTAERFRVDSRTMRHVLRSQLQDGSLALDGRPHRLVEFISRLSHLAASRGSGLLLVLDEVQQLLGPLDARAIVTFREFVWGIRTEQAPCAIVLCLDSLLEQRLERWAADLLHRIRDHGPVLQLAHIYQREFARWLWERQINSDADLPQHAISEDVLESLGQFVERPDLASGPRTTAEAFQRARRHFSESGGSYNLDDYLNDIENGALRFFGEGSLVRRLLLEHGADHWLREDPERLRWIRTLAVFPAGCPGEVLQERFPCASTRARLRTELFAPLLVTAPCGLALEALQRVRRATSDWERILAQSWNSLPALDVLMAHAPEVIRRLLLPRFFPPGKPGSPAWERCSARDEEDASGWIRLRGSFTEQFPRRDVAIWVDTTAPMEWPLDADLCIALVCEAETAGCIARQPEEQLAFGRVLLRLPLLQPLERRLPPELERYRKFVEPEPFRPAVLLSGLHELAALLENVAEGSPEREGLSGRELSRLEQAGACLETMIEVVSGEVIQGFVADALPCPVPLSGVDLLRALFAAACRSKYPAYQTLIRGHHWRENLQSYVRALQNSTLNDRQRQGAARIQGSKAELAEGLFGIRSTAAFDSLVRSLGVLLVIDGDSRATECSFLLHPAEKIALEYLRDIGSRQEVPINAVIERLRHFGYRQEESESVVELLVARQAVTRSPSGLVRLAPQEHALLMQVREDAEALARLLGRLTAAEPDAKVTERPETGAPITAWVRYRDTLHHQLLRATADLNEEREQTENKTLALLGEIRALEGADCITSGDFQTHLSGVSRELCQRREGLSSDLRRLLERIRGAGSPLSVADREWGLRWIATRPSLLRDLENYRQRLRELRTRDAGLREWLTLQTELHAVRTRLERLRSEHPGAAARLDALVTEYRARFATERWDPVSDASQFRARISPIEGEIQHLFFSEEEAYRQEFNNLCEGFRPLLQDSMRPISVPNEAAGITERFQRLYTWAIASFETVAQECAREIGSGAHWSHPTNRRKSWDRHWTQFIEALDTAKSATDYKTIHQVGDLVRAMVLGMDRGPEYCPTAAVVGSYENPDQPPDFEAIRELYRQGRIRIRIEDRD